MSLSIIQPILDRLAKGESITEFQQGILVGHYYTQSLPVPIQDATETCGSQSSGATTTTPTIQMNSYDRRTSPYEIPPNLARFLREPTEPTLLASDTSEVVRFQFPSQILNEVPAVVAVPTAPQTQQLKTVGNYISRPYLAHLREGETVEVRRKNSQIAFERLTVHFLVNRFHGFLCTSTNTIYRNLSAALSAFWSYKGAQAAQFCYVERNGVWVTLESLSALPPS